MACCDLGATLASQLRRFCDTEAFGTEYGRAGMSTEDRRVVPMLKAGMQKLEVEYQAPILWKVNEPQPPDNRPLAESRLRLLLSRFKKDPVFENKYRRAMEKNFNEVTWLSDSILLDPATVYYLPHFGVKKNRWSVDIRIVYDAAAKFKGRSLNDAINSGPVLKNSLS